jgi:predicted nucleic acid-binding Zn ribbon protein
MHALNTILRKFIKDFDISSGVKLASIRTRWEGIVGKTIAAHTSPYILKGKALTLTVDTPQWLHHLSFFKEEIKGKLENYHVEEIRFRVGVLPEQSLREEKEIEGEVSDSDKRYIVTTLSGIKDSELKERLRSLLVHAITKGRRGEGDKK